MFQCFNELKIKLLRFDSKFEIRNSKLNQLFYFELNANTKIYPPPCPLPLFPA